MDDIKTNIEYLISLASLVDGEKTTSSKYLSAVSFLRNRLRGLEPFVICKKCSSRIRSNTGGILVYCECGLTGVKGDEASFQLFANHEKHMVIFANPRKYIITL